MRLNAAKREKEELHYVPSMKRDFEKLASLKEGAGSRRVIRDALGDLLQEGKTHQATLENATQAVSYGRKVVKQGLMALEAGEQAALIGKLVRNARGAIGILDRPLPTLKRLDEKLEQLEKARAKSNLLSDLLQEAKAVKENACQLEIKVREAQRDLRRKSQGKCPLCGNRMDPLQSSAPTSI